MDTAFLYEFFIALGLGALIGLEREHRQDETQVIAGIRTFPLVSLSGFMVGLLAEGQRSDLIVAVGVLIASAMSITFHLVRHRLGTTGLTTPVALLVTFLLGLLIAFGFTQEAVVIGVATTFLLLTKRRLHRFAAYLDDEEMMSALQFITILFILFPLARSLEQPVPYTLGLVAPEGLIDPYEMLLLVIFVSTISFASFLAMREVGPQRGIYVSGTLGGLVNSEATTVSLAQVASNSPGLVPAAAVGTFLAQTTMVARNLAIAVFVDPSLTLLRYLSPVAALLILGSAGAAWMRRRNLPDARGARVNIRNPFAVIPALKFAMWFALVGAFAAVATTHPEYFGAWGVYLAALGAIASAGAVIASVGALAVTGKLSFTVAGTIGCLALIIGAANKLVILRATNRAVFDISWRAFTVVTVLGIVGLAATLLLMP